MQRKAAIGIVIAIVVVVALIPVGYAFAQRAAIASLEFKVNRLSLSDVDFSETRTYGTVKDIVNTVENPSASSLQQLVSLNDQIDSISTPELMAVDFLVNTRLVFSLFVDVHNPSSIDAVIDRAGVKVRVNGYELANPVTIASQARIAAGGDQTIELRGIGVNVRDLANILVNFASDDYVLTLDFAITSYFPTLFGDVGVPANVNAQLYMVSPKPSFDRQGGYQLIDYGSNSYGLTFANNNPVPVSGKVQVGVMKGNFLCDPGCLPVDHGFLTLARISLGSLDGIQVLEYSNLNLNSGSSYDIEVRNPDVRSDANSAFIIRWSPDYNKIPYVMTSELSGIRSTSVGEFESSTLSEVRRIVYNVVRDFGYLGSVEFRSSLGGSSTSGSTGFIGAGTGGSASPVATSITITPSANTAYYGDSITITGSLRDASGNGIANAVVYLKEDITLGIDRILGSTVTDNSGRYSMTWSVDEIGEIDIYTVFEGSTNYYQARSTNVKITGVEQQTQEPAEPTTQYYTTSISMQVSSTIVAEGDNLLISGWLTTAEGLNVQNAPVYIKDEDTGSGDDLIELVYTDSNGYYSYNWSARPMDPFDNVVEIYAVFEGASNLSNARSTQIDVTIT